MRSSSTGHLDQEDAMVQPLSNTKPPLRERLKDDTRLTLQVLFVIFGYLMLTLLLTFVVTVLPTLLA